MLQLLLFLLGTDAHVKGPGTAAPVKGPDHNANGESLYDHVDDGAAPMVRPGSKTGKHGRKGASSSQDDDDDHERELHREPGYAPTLHRPTPAAVAATACASSELPPALRTRLNTMCATESDVENTAGVAGQSRPAADVAEPGRSPEQPGASEA